ncbi:hypothetical protein GIB67_029278 [Kingdonia uniflora]|uniref:Aminotransferase-like plant mobile domain-containing protein n=1 Tax=Kingdonia uniflora TaxID=39325 RepID=A0A7J7N869_9MAGN|nr:hypothetical protein GIB67_029278 [Kingdonia uniflora]
MNHKAINIRVTWDDSDNEHDNNESHPQVVDTGNYCAYPVFFNCGNNNFNVFELENPDENQCNQEQNESEEFEDPHLEDLNSHILAKCIKLGKLNKVLKDQVNTLTSKLQDKTESTSHEIEVLENEKQDLHDKAVFLEKEVNDAKEKIKSTLDELRLTKLDVVLSQQKLQKFYHGAMNIDKILCMGKTDSDKRGLGYEESLSKAKTPQITKFVKVTASISIPKHNVISTTHDHSKRASYSKIYYCNLCGRRGHIAFFCRFVGPYQSHALSFNGYKYNSNVISTNEKSENVPRSFAQKTIEVREDDNTTENLETSSSDILTSSSTSKVGSPLSSSSFPAQPPPPALTALHPGWQQVRKDHSNADIIGDPTSRVQSRIRLEVLCCWGSNSVKLELFVSNWYSRWFEEIIGVSGVYSGLSYFVLSAMVTLDREELSVNYPDVSSVFHSFGARGWTGILELQFPCYPRLVRLIYASLRVMHGTGINKTFSVSLDGSVFDIDSDDVRKAFGLGDSDNPDVNYLMWPPVLTEFPPNEEMEEELIVDLVLVIMHEMFTTANLDHQTRTLQYDRFISQLLIDKGYVIRPDEEVDVKNDVINAQYWKKSRKHMIVEKESESDGDAEDSRAETLSARQAARPSTSWTATTSVPGTSPSVSTGLVPHDFASMYTFMETRFASMHTQIQTQFQLVRVDIGQLLTFVDGLSSIASALSCGYPGSVNAREATTAGLNVSEQLQREIGARRCENAELIARRFIGREITMRSVYRVCGDDNSGKAVDTPSFKIVFIFNAIALFTSLAVVVVQITLVRGEQNRKVGCYFGYAVTLGFKNIAVMNGEEEDEEKERVNLRNTLMLPIILANDPDISKLMNLQSTLTTLVDAYLRWGSNVGVARELFNEMLERNIVSWIAMMSGYARVGMIGNAIELFEEMPERDPSWNALQGAVTPQEDMDLETPSTNKGNIETSSNSQGEPGEDSSTNDKASSDSQGESERGTIGSNKEGRGKNNNNESNSSKIEASEYGPRDNSLLTSFETHRVKVIVLGQELGCLWVFHYSPSWDIAFSERWHPKTNTFHFKWGEITLTLKDVWRLVSLRVEGDITVVQGKWGANNVKQLFRDCLFQSDQVYQDLKAGGQGISLSLVKIVDFFAYKLKGKNTKDHVGAEVDKASSLSEPVVWDPYLEKRKDAPSFKKIVDFTGLFGSPKHKELYYLDILQQQFNRRQTMPRVPIYLEKSALYFATEPCAYKPKYEWEDLFSEGKWKDFIILMKWKKVPDGIPVYNVVDLDENDDATKKRDADGVSHNENVEGQVHFRCNKDIRRLEEEISNWKTEVISLKSAKEVEDRDISELVKALELKTVECDSLREANNRLEPDPLAKQVVDSICEKKFSETIKKLNDKVLECENLNAINEKLMHQVAKQEPQPIPLNLVAMLEGTDIGDQEWKKKYELNAKNMKKLKGN